MYPHLNNFGDTSREGPRNRTSEPCIITMYLLTETQKLYLNCILILRSLDILLPWATQRISDP